MNNNQDNQFQEWDNIFNEIDNFRQENPNFNFQKRPKTYKNEHGEVCCTKCGSTQDISTCPECVSENEFLKTK